MNKRTEVLDAQARCMVPIKWLIIGHDNYGFATNKKCYNLSTGFEIKQVVKGGYTRGYNLAGSFYSLLQLRPLLCLVKPTQRANGIFPQRMQVENEGW